MSGQLAAKRTEINHSTMKNIVPEAKDNGHPIVLTSIITESNRNGYSLIPNVVAEVDGNGYWLIPNRVAEVDGNGYSLIPNRVAEVDGNKHFRVPIISESSQDEHRLFRRLEGKVAIITGGARGIGAATLRLFAKHGATVIIADIDDTAGENLSASLAPAATYVHCDVSRGKDVAEFVKVTVAKYGKLNIMYDSAGILGEQSKRNSIMEFDGEEFDRIIRVNVEGVGLRMKHAERVMVPRRKGCIISTASVAGVLGGLGPHAYTASKHAIIGLTKNAACELGKYAIRVNSISPFGIATSMLINARRESDPENADMLEDSEHQKKKIEELVTGLANLKGPTLRAKNIAEAACILPAMNLSM
eukprot:PITA_16045